MNPPKTNRKKGTNAGFSLMEMLVVVAIIGIFGGIMIPNIGDINNSAQISAAKSTGDVIDLVLNSAATCGYNYAREDGWTSATTGADILDKAISGAVIPVSVGGSFAGKNFHIGAIEAKERGYIESNFSYDPVNNRIVYRPW